MYDIKSSMIHLLSTTISHKTHNQTSTALGVLFGEPVLKTGRPLLLQCSLQRNDSFYSFTGSVFHFPRRRRRRRKKERVNDQSKRGKRGEQNSQHRLRRRPPGVRPYVRRLYRLS